ncbi:MAG: diguanylate cyclase [Xanthomonadales bacterium]|nr:diguanylate cyclase [Xanthomonadales bacterium]
MTALPQPARALDPDKPFSQYVVDRWSVQHGFPQVSALQIVQDHAGYIWASTQSGLARFDGVRFENFDVRNTPELMTNHLETLLVHSDGSLWIGSARGAVVMRDQRFVVALRSEQQGTGPVQALAEHPDGGVWLGAERGLFHLNGELIKVLDGAVLSLLAVDDELLIGRRGAVERLIGGSVHRTELPDPGMRAEHLAGDAASLWIGTDRGLLHRTNDGIEPVSLQARFEQVESLYLDRHGSLWIGGYEALLRRFPDGSIEVIDQDQLGFRPWIISATEDHEGNLWLGSNTHSLIRLWDGWTRRYSARQGLADPFVWTVAEDPARGIWIGTNSGLSYLDDGDVKNVVPGDRLPAPAVYTILPTGPGCALLGTRGGGVAAYCDGEISVPDGAQPLAGRQINGLLDTGDGLWIATDEGLAIMRNGELEWQPGFEGQSRRVRIVHPNPAGLLVGTEGGLFLSSSGSVAQVGLESPLEEAFVTAINDLPDGRIAVGTLGRGLFVGRPGEGWIQLQEEWGLPSGGLFHLDSHGDGYLWVGGEVGAYRIRLDSIPDGTDATPRPLGIQNLASTNRLSGSQPARCCNGAGLAKGLFAAGSLWFPTLDGVLEIQPDKIARPTGQPRVLVESIEIGNDRRIEGQREIGLGPKFRDFAIQFTALTYQDPRNVIFRYRLRGYDAEWVWAGRRRTAYYTNLQPGTYTFEVEASLGTQRWIPASEPMTITIAPTWIETMWFKMLVALSVFLVFALIYLVRVRESDRVRQRLEQVVQERTRALDEANRLLRDANQKLETASETDPLTGLHNRRFIQSRLSPGSPLFRPGRMPLLVVLVDIDHFKHVNDLHGHPAGDEVLRQFGRLLAAEVREGDAAVRWGGEEFLLLLGPTPEHRATAVLERLRRAIERSRFELEGATLIRMSCSFGAVPLVEGDQAFERRWALSLELADRALYAVKQGGRNGWGLVVNPADLALQPDEDDPNLAIDRGLEQGSLQVRASRTEIARLFKQGTRRSSKARG